MAAMCRDETVTARAVLPLDLSDILLYPVPYGPYSLLEWSTGFVYNA